MAGIVKESCVICAVEFGLSSDHKNDLKQTGRSYSCPNGHRQHYNKPVPELEALRTKVKTLEKQAEKDKATIEELTREVEIWRPASAEPKKTT